MNACFKFTYKQIKSEDMNLLKYQLCANRNVRNISENKLGPHFNISGWDSRSQMNFIYYMKSNYNKLNRNITLSNTIQTFWLNKISQVPNCTIPNRVDNIITEPSYLIPYEIINKCIT